MGDEKVEEAQFNKFTLSEQAMIQRLKEGALDSRFWWCYRNLRGRGFGIDDSVIGAWKTCGHRARGKVPTQQALSALLGKERTTFWRRWQNAELQATAFALGEDWWKERIPDIDEAVYRAAVFSEGTAADRKLAYQRAKVPLSGEDAEAVDPWADAITKAREQAQKD